ncbi:LysM peptidoglycan-binding domain-containing protein [Roseobacter denitrificans]|uniref:LysM domain protein n=1 Tax=Roseobacter denitrificans (strain ATCC 33942 / OCh 114) TaxID=375451 RepID=Q169F0_ROSDO|nr:LysM peptidoglycan-binding domain-containing protein [Roseobacter denitrificans]ABG31393.1 lysM domain protein [Roseobacter denitrificans OCh 114]AVL54413.1 LysM peptidoglycan-binding domain-containing protein [Roseobacter denitrificans]SFG00543.1 LysM domain-containing protein [Roseobacter denitrificans OCh 114]
MKDNGSANPSQSTGLLTAGLVIAGLIAAAVFLSMRDSGRLSEEAVAVLESSGGAGGNQVVTQQIEADDAPQEIPQDAPQDAPVAQTEPEEAAPTIDEVRVDTGGTMVIAGRAGPGAQVDVLLDGEVVTTAQADSTGSFAAVSSVTADEGARSLTLRSGEGDEAVASVDEIILAPVTPLADLPPPDAAPDQPETATAPTAMVQDAGTGAEPAQDEEPAQAVQEIAAVDPPAPDQSDVAPPAEAEAAPTAEGTEDPAIAVLRSDAQGVSRVQTAPASRIMLDTISYSDAGDVQLGGRAGTGAVEVRAYLDNRAVARMRVEPDGQWRGVIEDVAAGIYRLRVDALGQDGAVTSRLETPFKREAPAVLEAATQAATGQIQAITVQAGDTLWAIARERYGEGLLYVQVFEANRSEIRDPDLIYPGQVFDLPAD